MGDELAGTMVDGAGAEAEAGGEMEAGERAGWRERVEAGEGEGEDMVEDERMIGWEGMGSGSTNTMGSVAGYDCCCSEEAMVLGGLDDRWSQSMGVGRSNGEGVRWKRGSAAQSGESPVVFCGRRASG